MRTPRPTLNRGSPSLGQMRRFLILLVFALATAACTAGDVAAVPGGAETSSTTSVVATTTTADTVPPTSAATTTSTTTTATTTAPTTSAPVPIGVPVEPRPEAAAPEPQIVDGFQGEGVVTVAAGGADLYDDFAAEPFVTAREGLLFAAQGMSGEWIEVFTSCDVPAWVHSSQVMAQPPSESGEIGAGFDFGTATIVVDPGHGGPWNTGAVSPSGLVEKEINLDIARRVRDLLSESHTIDWGSGEILTGDAIPAAGWVLMTRVGDGGDADYEAGLFYRSYLANAANADAMVSIHNNAGWEVRMSSPGTDVYYQSQLAESRRFAKIMVEELLRSFAPFDANWAGAVATGAKSRLSPRQGNFQYYGILRRSAMPTVITEGAYIANQSEADLLATAEFRQAYAEGVYRALIRFLTTDDVGGGRDLDPEIWRGDAGSGDARPDCLIPSQPEGP